MTEPREFKFKNDRWHCRLMFFPDRIEYMWDKWGLGVDKGKTVVIADAISPHLSEGKGSGGFAPIVTRAGLFATLAIFSFALLEGPWRSVGYFFVASAALSLFFAFSKMRLVHWVNILKKDGDIAVGVIVTKWTETERMEFKEFFDSWLRHEKQD